MIACIDIGGTAIKFGVLDLQGKIVEKTSLEVNHDFNGLINSLVSFVEEAKQQYKVTGVSISSPGAVDSKTGMVNGSSAIPCIHGHNWKKIMGEATNLPISIENDANCAALAEVFNGSGQSFSDVLFLVCGTGLGGAIIHDGKIHHGKNLHGGEFGYMLMEERDGEFYNFSNVASTMSFVRKARAHFQDDSYDGIKVFEEATKGNEFCQNILDRFYLNLAKGIFNMQYFYDPEIILIGGAISQREDFIEKINEKIDYLLEKIEIAKVKPVLGACTHKGDANLIGALANFISEHQSNNLESK
ncbi:MAG: ROK family protein [Turicibacter sanguinis]